MAMLTREQLEEGLAALHEVSLELVRDLSVEVDLERIAELARQQANASYAALGVVDNEGNLVKFIPVGMSPEEVRRAGAPPIGKGMIGAIGNERGTIRVSDLRF